MFVTSLSSPCIWPLAGSGASGVRVTVGEKSPLHFYEKVIKVKADVAALHIFSSDIDDAASGGVEICQGRRF